LVFASPSPFPYHRPICPIDALPDPLRSAALHVILDKEAPATCALTDALAAAGAVVHCGFDCVAPDGERLPATLNTCALAPTATGKGRSFKVFFKHFLEAKKTRPPRTATGDVVAVRIPRVETLVSRTLSYAKLVEMLDGHSMTMTLQREDGASLLKTDLFKDNTDALTQLWSGDPPLDNFVHGVELECTDGRGSVGFRIQPTLMYDYVAGPGRMDCEVGLWPRAIIGCHDPERFPENETYWVKPGRHSPEAFHARTCQLANQINQTRQAGDLNRTGIELDTHARAYLLELGHHLKLWIPNDYRDIRPAAGRAWENTLRVAVVLQVFCNGAGPVSVDMVHRAWTIVEWSLSQYRWVFVQAPALYSGKARKTTGARSTVPQLQASKPFKQPKAKTMPRPWENGQWLLTCLAQAHRSPFVSEAPLDEIRRMADLPEKSFQAALAWLEHTGAVQTWQTDQGIFIRRLPQRISPAL
jgi:hypothetical protein